MYWKDSIEKSTSHVIKRSHTIEIMSFVSANASNEAVQKFLEILQNDFRTLANETKKKYPQIKEVGRFAMHLSILHVLYILTLSAPFSFSSNIFWLNSIASV